MVCLHKKNESTSRVRASQTWTMARGSSDLGLHVVEPSGGKQHLQIEITYILTVRCSSKRVFCLGQFHRSTIKPLQRHQDQTPAPPEGGQRTSKSRPYFKYPCTVCTRNVTSRGVSYQCNRCSGWVHVKFSGLINAAQYWKSKETTCDQRRTN